MAYHDELGTYQKRSSNYKIELMKLKRIKLDWLLHLFVLDDIAI